MFGPIQQPGSTVERAAHVTDVLGGAPSASPPSAETAVRLHFGMNGALHVDAEKPRHPAKEGDQV